MLSPRLVAPDGAAVMIVVNYDANYLTARSVTNVERIESIARQELAADLNMEVTGSGGLGRDLTRVSEAAFVRTTKVTLVALVIILSLIYRAPLALCVPLVAIGISVAAALEILNHTTRLGWGVSALERTLTVVLLFGSGTDYALFWISSFREQLGAELDRRRAALRATILTGPSIMGSAATTVFGLMMLMTADLVPFFNAGRSLALGLCVSLAAALTLVPALSLLMGGLMFWPQKVKPGSARWNWPTDRLWQRLGRLVAARPGMICAVVIIACAWPAWRGWRASYTYDALGVVPNSSGTSRGQRVVARHFPADQLFSWNLLIESDQITADLDSNAQIAGRLTDRIHVVEGVSDVWHLSAPLGSQARGGVAGLTGQWARKRAAPFYVNPDEHALRFEIMQDDGAFSRRSMKSCDKVLQRVRAQLDLVLDEGATIHATGLTPYILNIKTVADSDQRRVTALVLGAILVIVCGVLRRVMLPVYILLATVLAYMVTIGVTERVFVIFQEAEGIDWKVRLFSFVILVAVGQDYNIFLVSRILREQKERSAPSAVGHAIVKGGPVVASCGLIMAATLGSLAATGLPFFQELGLAFACGVLIASAVLCPLLVPALYLAFTARDSQFESLAVDSVSGDDAD